MGLIPAFAFAYFIDGSGFFESSATHEPYYVDNVLSVEHGVANGVARQIYEEAAFKGQTSSYIVPPDGLDASISATDLTVTLGFATTKAVYYPLRVDIPLGELFSVSNDDLKLRLPSYLKSPNGYIGVAYSIQADQGLVTAAAALGEVALFQEATSQVDLPFLPLAPREFSALSRAVASTEGSVEALPYEWLRMLYFSAVTVTTLGYGDITPTTLPTRMLVACEAVVGVIVIGLFLNAVARRRDQGPLLRRPRP